MSYCQKHRNHHCVHTHNCNDPNHKNKKQRINSASGKCKSSSKIINNKYKPPLAIIEDNQQCQFNYQQLYKYSGSNLTIEAYANKISVLSEELQNTKRNYLSSDIENRKLKQRNTHIQCQIQYLRQQLDLLVNNHNTDISKQIKKHLIQHTNLNIKIKELMSTLIDKEKKIEQLSSDNYSLSRKNKYLEKTIASLYQRIKLITQKKQQILSQNNESNWKYKSLQKEFKSFKEKFNLLSSSIDVQIKQKGNKIQSLSDKKSNLQKSLKKKSQQNKNQKQLHEIQKKALQKMIEDLKENLKKKQGQCQRLKAKTQQLQNNLVQIKEDYQHSKKIILKYQKMNEKSQKIKEHINEHNKVSDVQINEDGKKTISKINKHINSADQQNQKLLQLEKQNLQLKNKIRQLGSKISQPFKNKTNFQNNTQSNNVQNIIINQELILSIGASEQFKKIVQQKNVTIKQLMRQKTHLYNLVYEQQLNKH